MKPAGRCLLRRAEFRRASHCRDRRQRRAIFRRRCRRGGFWRQSSRREFARAIVAGTIDCENSPNPAVRPAHPRRGDGDDYARGFRPKCILRRVATPKCRIASGAVSAHERAQPRRKAFIDDRQNARFQLDAELFEMAALVSKARIRSPEGLSVHAGKRPEARDENPAHRCERSARSHFGKAVAKKRNTCCRGYGKRKRVVTSTRQVQAEYA